ncbi:glycosyltransferase family 4 protein [Fusobacterium necrogenes]|uniref:glycosyltransferase family 4 protein n=1 Tax=Fusobacterium necrogenes TaxID=858 RepID=UPI00255CF062|nr:glycosyltransferase family 4 protein [Fusobacterium necrogenes]
MKKKIITFLLPGESRNPIGGYKIVYEYANRLVKDSYKVNIVYPATLLWKEQNVYQKLKGIIRYFYFKANKNRYLPYNWFPLDKKIKIFWTPALEEKYIPKSDYIVATAWQTSEYLGNYIKKYKKKIYLIQHYELWGCTEERLLNTWKLPLEKIVIAKWLKNISDRLGEKSKLIHNGLDFKKFYIEKNIEKRDKKTIICLYHENDWKGFKYGLETFKILKERYSEIRIICFGAYKNPKNLPNWIEYYYSPEQNKLRKLYNEASIFLGTSLGEGWGLTVSEAMQCGCAVVCTDVVGYNEMAFDRKTALLCESKNFEDMARKIGELLDNNELRMKIAKAGNKFIQKFTWEEAYSKFKNFIEEGE